MGCNLQYPRCKLSPWTYLGRCILPYAIVMESWTAVVSWIAKKGGLLETSVLWNRRYPACLGIARRLCAVACVATYPDHVRNNGGLTADGQHNVVRQVNARMTVGCTLGERRLHEVQR